MSLPLPDFYDPKQVSQLYLERAGLVSRRVAGRDHFLSLERKPFDDLTQWMLQTREFWTARLDALEAALRAEDAIAAAKNPPKRRKK